MNHPPFLIFTFVFLLLSFVAISSFSNSNEIINDSIQDFTFGLVPLSFAASDSISVNGASAGYTNDAESFTINHPNVATFTNTVAVVAVSTESGVPVNSVTWEGLPMTEQRTDTFSDGAGSSIWTIALGSSGGCTGTCDVDVTLDEEKKSSTGIIVFDGVHQTLPIDASTGSNGETKNPSVSITTNFANSLVVDALSIESISITATDPQNWKADDGILGASQRQTTTTAGSYISDWTGGDNKKWALSVIALRTYAAPSTVHSVILQHADIEINQPVRWTGTVDFVEPQTTVALEIPSTATITQILDSVGGNIAFSEVTDPASLNPSIPVVHIPDPEVMEEGSQTKLFLIEQVVQTFTIECDTPAPLILKKITKQQQTCITLRFL